MPLEKPVFISDVDLGIIGDYWEPGKLMLDYDGEIPDRVNDIAWILGRLDIRVIRLEARQTKRGYHVIVYTNGYHLSPVEIVCLQALMGSDFKRETFNMVRAMAVDMANPFQVARWQVLFKSKLGDAPMPTLRDVATEVADELTSPSNGPMGTRLMKWAPPLVALGQKLKNAAQQDGGTQIVMRNDVLRFAQKMAATMDIKDAEKGKIADTFTFQDAMRELEGHYNKLREMFGPGGEINPYMTLQRLIHIANLCMITHNVVTRPAVRELPAHAPDCPCPFCATERASKAPTPPEAA